MTVERSPSTNKITAFSLPIEIWLHILQYLPAPALIAFSLVSQWAEKIANTPTLWKQLYHNEIERLPSSFFTDYKKEFFTVAKTTQTWFEYQNLTIFSIRHYKTKGNNKAVFTSDTPEMKGLRFLAKIISYQEKIDSYPEPAKSLFNHFLLSVKNNFSLHFVSTQNKLEKSFQILLLILEYCFFTQNININLRIKNNINKLKDIFEKSCIPLISQNITSQDEVFLININKTLEHLNTKKLTIALKKLLQYNNIQISLDADFIKIAEAFNFYLSTLPESPSTLYDTINPGVNDSLANETPEIWRSLDLSEAGISRIPKIIQKLVNLEELSITQANLFTIPLEVTHLIHLRALDVSNNNIYLLPPEIEKLKKLESLNISDNNLIFLPHTMSTLQKLVILLAQNNKLITLPACNYLNQLKILNLSENEIIFLPKSINNLSALMVLDISNNLLKSLPEIGALKQLESLDFSSNPITHLPDLDTNKLTFLNLNGTYILDVPKEIKELPTLRALTLGSSAPLHSLRR